MSRLIAVKPLNYGTRRLQAGDMFDAMPHDEANARLLVILGFAKDADDQAEADELQALQLRYEDKYGRPADKRWGARRLRAALGNN